MSIRRRPGSPFYWYDFTVRGARFRGSTKQTDRRKAALAEAELIHAAEAATKPVECWAIRHLFGAYWQEHAQYLRTADEIFFKFEMMSEFFGKDRPMAELTNALVMDYRAARRGGSIALPEDILEQRAKSWRARFVDEKGRVKGVAAQSVNRDLAHLQGALSWARTMHRQTVPELAWSKLKVAEQPHRIRFASADEFARLMQAAHEDLRPIILAAVTTGLRRANILGLQWHQVDLTAGTITVPSTKSGKPMVARLTAPLRAALARTPAKDRKGDVFALTNWRRRWAAAMKAAGLEDFRFHDLRHTFASWARQNGADLADICEALNHSSVSVTMRYAHVRKGEDVTAFDRVAQLFTAQSASQKIAKH